jgi:hypothetical protein
MSRIAETYARFARAAEILLCVAVFAVIVSYLAVWYGGAARIADEKQLTYPLDTFPIAVARVANGHTVAEGFIFYFNLKTLWMPPDLRLLQPQTRTRTLRHIGYGQYEPVPSWHATLRWTTNLRGEKYVEVSAVNPQAEESFGSQGFYRIRGDRVVPAYFRSPFVRYFARGPMILAFPGFVLMPYLALLCIRDARRNRTRSRLPFALGAGRVVGLALAAACWAVCAWPLLFGAWQVPEVVGGLLALVIVGGLLWLQATSPQWATTVSIAAALPAVGYPAASGGPHVLAVLFSVLWVANTILWFVLGIWTLRRQRGVEEVKVVSYNQPELTWTLCILTAVFSLTMWPWFWKPLIDHL